MKTFDCTTIVRSTHGRAAIKQAEFQILGMDGKPAVSVFFQKQHDKNTWSAGNLTLADVGRDRGIGNMKSKVIRMTALENKSKGKQYWRNFYWSEVIPFIDSLESLKIRLEGVAEPNSSCLCLADYAKCLGLKVTVGPDKFYLLDYDVLLRFGKDGVGLTDNPKFPGRYSFGQMCHILFLIAGKPDIDLD
jgi:hypothetical protein